jgi:hypothetical protein
MYLDSKYFDCRWIVKDEIFYPGREYRIGVKFLFPDDVLPLLALGKHIQMWEGKVIAEGVIEELL